MFEAIGTLHSFTQQYQLKKSAKQKVKTGQTFDWKDARSTFVKAQEETRATKSVFEMYAGKTEKNDAAAKSARKSSIKQKLRRGKKLSPQDLEYLRQTDEALYEKAKTTMEEREKLERALKSAKTKAEAQRAVAIAYANAAALMSGNIGGGAAAGVSSGGGEAVSVEAGAAANTEAGASSFDAGTAVNGEIAATAETGASDAKAAGTENVSADGAAEATNAAGAEAAGSEVNAETGEKVAQENKDAASSLQQTGQDIEFDDPLILLVLRHLKAEWNDFMRSKTYRDLPEDEIQEARRRGTESARQQRQRAEAVKAVSLTAAATAYQTAELGEEASHVLGTVGATK